MQLIANGTQVSSTMPTKQAASGTPGYANNTPGNGTATVVDADVLNTWLAEMVNVILAAGLTLDPTNNAQLLAAIAHMVGVETTRAGTAEATKGGLAATNTWTGANTFTASGTNPAQIELSQTGGGHNWFVIADHSGNLSFYDGTAVASRFSVSPAGVVNFSLPPAIPNGTVSDNPVALGQFGFSTGGGGSIQHLPSGLMFQIGSFTGGVTLPTNVVFPTAFPNACLGVWPLESHASGSWGALAPTAYGADTATTTGCPIYALKWGGSEWQASGGTSCTYLAIGY